MFSQKITIWHDAHGRKNLPWQKNKTTYRVWLSEIMLQQTQVATVIPYFEKFIKVFSTVRDLANANEDTVMSLWSGLGYYARARNLHKTAKLIVQNHNGNFPKTIEALEQLPGIGRSTAGAILSFSHDLHAVILDGNVKRVLARHFLIEEDLTKATTLKKLWLLAKRLTPKKSVAKYNQAIMDIGATICVRKNPLCHECPVKKTCKASQFQQQHELPLSIKTKKIPTKKTILLILKNNKNEICLEKRPPVGIWGSLWSLPEITHIDELDLFLKKRSFNLVSKTKRDILKHTLSHFHLNIQPIEIIVTAKNNHVMEDNQKWFDIKTALQQGLPKPIRTIISKKLII